MRNFICLFALLEFLMAENYTNWSYGPAYPPGPQYQSSYEPAYQPAYSTSHNEPSEKTWTIRTLKNPIRVSKPKLLPPGGDPVFDVGKEIEKLKKTACYPAKERIEFWKDAKTIREYYELVEPTSPIYSTHERMMKMVEFIDERWPSVRKIYKKYYEEKLAEFKGGNIIDRITVDYMIEQYKKVHSSCSKLSKPFYYKEC
ncbi:hypothetical protein CAEBREN_22303 [Caenorhabditis brenneri]|uniref:Uncharacterized protein n=1 Tax=Caenorhabditis brenneri TaxID=135651 RepID=G0N6L9_CAEBE|nr:hypothetical protein CAEBREN_22303 [Caenorhabditis brenneri]